MIFYSVSFTILMILAAGVIPACEDSGTEFRYPEGSITEDHSNIADPYLRWQAYGLTSYVIEQQSECFCILGGEKCKVYVRDNMIVDVIKESDGQSVLAQVPQRYKTVEELFALARSLNPDSVASLVIQYDERFGFPTIIAVDRSFQMADEEFAYITDHLAHLPR